MARVLVLGSGGREHAFVYKIAQSPLCEALFVAPGNAGTARHAQNVNIDPMDFEAVARFCQEKSIDLLVPGPEAPLVAGIRDVLEAQPQLKGLKIVGPSQKAARLEGSKDFAKQFMQRYGIPTARYRTFEAGQLQQALDYLQQHPLPVVLKADGLAAGKGVLICESHEQAVEEMKAMLSGKFGEASRKVVVEEFLQGIEVSVFVLTDGKDYLVLPEAKDYKRIGEGDTGLNTGGMGAVSPVPFVNKDFIGKVEERIIRPTLQGLQQEQAPYCGFIFLGLMNVNGDPYVIEYNVRMGDPETQSVFARIESDLLELLDATAAGTLKHQSLQISPYTAVTVVLASQGYPQTYEKDKVIEGFDEVEEAIIFHAGTRQDDKGQILTAGGRVLAVTSLAETLPQARQLAMKAAATIRFSNKYYRRDIGLDLERYEQEAEASRQN